MFFDWDSTYWDGSTSNDVSAADQAFYDKHGFWGQTGGSYGLNPEIMESLYYACKKSLPLAIVGTNVICCTDLVTGNTTYQDWSYDVFLAINKTCRQGSGYTGIGDVSNITGGSPDDNQPSFWFAESLTYLYRPRSKCLMESRGR